MAKDQFDTFDSAGGPTNKEAGESAHADSSSGLKSPSVQQGDVPTVPQQGSK